MFADGDAGRAGAVDDDVHRVHSFADHLQGVEQGGADHNGGPVLIVVEDGNIAELLQAAFDLEASWSGDVLQIDTAEGAGEQPDCADDFIHVLAFDAQWDGVHIPEGFEQDAFSFHNRHTGFGADVTEAEDRGAVCDDGDGVPPPCEIEAFFGMSLDFQTGLRYAGGVGEAEGLAAVNPCPGLDFQLSAQRVVELQGFFCVVHERFSL